jgi:DNA polymerase-3 subunit gamma/tau
VSDEAADQPAVPTDSAEAEPAVAEERGVEAAGPAGDGENINIAVVRASWDELLTAIRPHSRMVEALLKDCKPISVDGDTLTLGFFYAFHKQRVEEPENKSLITAMLKRVLGTSLRMRCVMIDKDTAVQEVQKRRPKDKYQQAAEDPVIRAAVEQFGAQIAGIESAPSALEDEKE